MMSSRTRESVLLHYDPRDIAREITLIDRGALIQIDYSYWVNLKSANEVLLAVQLFVCHKFVSLLYLTYPIVHHLWSSDNRHEFGREISLQFFNTNT